MQEDDLSAEQSEKDPLTFESNSFDELFIGCPCHCWGSVHTFCKLTISDMRLENLNVRNIKVNNRVFSSLSYFGDMVHNLLISYGPIYKLSWNQDKNAIFTFAPKHSFEKLKDAYQPYQGTENSLALNYYGHKISTTLLCARTQAGQNNMDENI